MEGKTHPSIVHSIQVEEPQQSQDTEGNHDPAAHAASNAPETTPHQHE